MANEKDETARQATGKPDGEQAPPGIAPGDANTVTANDAADEPPPLAPKGHAVEPGVAALYYTDGSGSYTRHQVYRTLDAAVKAFGDRKHPEAANEGVVIAEPAGREWPATLYANEVAAYSPAAHMRATT